MEYMPADERNETQSKGIRSDLLGYISRNRMDDDASINVEFLSNRMEYNAAIQKYYAINIIEMQHSPRNNGHASENPVPNQLIGQVDWNPE